MTIENFKACPFRVQDLFHNKDRKTQVCKTFRNTFVQKQSHKNEITQGSLVWIVDTDNPRGSYPLALVDKLHLGDDGRVRSAILKTKSGSLVRPLVKLVPLPDIGSCDQERGPGCSGRELN